MIFIKTRHIIATTIRSAREAAGLNQAQLAKKTKTIHPRTVSRIEYGDTCKIASVVEVLDALDLKLAIVPK